MANHQDVDRDEADTILRLRKTAPVTEWRSVSQGRIERWRMAVGVQTEVGVFKKALVVELECLRSARPLRECYKLSLFKNDLGAQRRVYQLDTTTVPLGQPDNHNWPHEHIGKDRPALPSCGYPATFEDALAHFERVTNIHFEEPVESPFDFRLC